MRTNYNIQKNVYLTEILGTIAAISTVATTGMYIYRSIFIARSTKMITNMKMELQSVGDNDRKKASEIVYKYSYNIDAYGKKVNPKMSKGLEHEIRNNLYDPLMSIIMDKTNKFWKIKALDYLTTDRIQSILQHAVLAIFPVMGFFGGTQKAAINKIRNSVISRGNVAAGANNVNPVVQQQS